MRILVTGAAGFVGSHLCEALLQAGHTVVGLDAFIPFYPRPRKEANLAAARAHPRFSFHELDLRTDDLMPALSGVDAVIHEAAMAGLPLSWTQFSEYMSCNLLGTQRLLEACRTLPTPLSRFVHISTSSVYGAEAVGDETQPTRPVSPYGVTKLAAEHLVRAYIQGYGLPAVILRYFSIYGPRQRPDMAYQHFITSMLAGETITIFGDGEQTRSNTFVSDAVAGTLLALERGTVGEAYNIGGGEVLSLKRAVELLGAALGTEPRIAWAPARLGDQRHTAADVGKARAHLGYTPRVGAEEGLRAQVAWNREMQRQ